MLESLDSSLPSFHTIVIRRLAKPGAGDFHHAPDKANRNMLQASLYFRVKVYRPGNYCRQYKEGSYKACNLSSMARGK